MRCPRARLPAASHSTSCRPWELVCAIHFPLYKVAEKGLPLYPIGFCEDQRRNRP